MSTWINSILKKTPSSPKKLTGAKRYHVRIKPDCVDAINVLGVVLYYAGRTDEAITQFNRALQINPQCASARKNLNIALVKKQKTQIIQDVNK